MTLSIPSAICTTVIIIIIINIIRLHRRSKTFSVCQRKLSIVAFAEADFFIQILNWISLHRPHKSLPLPQWCLQNQTWHQRPVQCHGQEARFFVCHCSSPNHRVHQCSEFCLRWCWNKKKNGYSKAPSTRVLGLWPSYFVDIFWSVHSAYVILNILYPGCNSILTH